jgi:hypothetical protein
MQHGRRNAKPFRAGMCVSPSRHQERLADLFFPDHTVDFRHPGWRATGPQAAHAVLNFLTTGRADWDCVVGVAP